MRDPRDPGHPPGPTAGAASPSPEAAARPERRALVMVNDLMLGSRIRSVLEALAIRPIFLRSAQDAASAPSERPALLIVDLDAAALSPLDAIGAAKRTGVPVLAYGSHVEGARLDAARQAGADQVVPRSAIAARLDELVTNLLDRTL